jgi:hypothetical protein
MLSHPLAPLSPILQMYHFTLVFLTIGVQVAGEKCLLHVESYFCHGSPGFNLPCTSCIICYDAAEIVEIFQILQLFLIYHNLYWNGCLEILITSVFLHPFPFHNIFHISVMSCSTTFLHVS